MSGIVMFVVIVYLGGYAWFMHHSGRVKDRYIDDLEKNLSFERGLRYRAAFNKDSAV